MSSSSYSAASLRKEIVQLQEDNAHLKEQLAKESAKTKRALKAAEDLLAMENDRKCEITRLERKLSSMEAELTHLRAQEP
jgi:hypothetical protein